MKGQRILTTFVAALIGGIVSVAAYSLLYTNQNTGITPSVTNAKPVMLTGPVPDDSNATTFTYAAERSVHAVVHVMTTYQANTAYSYGNPLFDFFFGPQNRPEPQPQMGSGSGVIVTQDGYIVTNNHVIDNADKVQVVLNDKRTFEAKIVGRDPSIDLALLKISADSDLPFIPFGNSEALKVGEWVLAVGNPFNLTSTVTAGIVSAKARNINILRESYAIESFIQTDAAVNPGNSGGALVNLKGELIGINTAIASRTGSFTGYSFAIPTSIVQKTVLDIIEFGEVQRAILGVYLNEINQEKANEIGLKDIKGVLVKEVNEGGAADEAGLEVNDVITHINGVEVNSSSQLQEQVSKYRPNDKVEVSIIRNNKKKQFTATLRNKKGGTEIVKPTEINTLLGASFTELPEPQKQKLGLKYGIQVTDVTEGKFRNSGIKKGFIITKVNRTPIRTTDDLKRAFEFASGGVLVEGVYPNGVVAYYAVGM
ncbi:MAG: Do family serine endopeptidase [Bacteroidales bacterium]|nr:Do family serine endopeptidase [Bacteroidales bacterium]MBN2750280.1 Do family serine endopeptidase [Bacteroidales bacterium]